MPLEWKPFLDGQMAASSSQDGTVNLFFNGGGGQGREDSYSCRMTAPEARVLALALLGQLREMLPPTKEGGGGLVLSRFADEEVLIGNDIAVCVVDIRRDRVRLQIRAPKSMPIYRPEVLERMPAEDRSTAVVDVPAAPIAQGGAA